MYYVLDYRSIVSFDHDVSVRYIKDIKLQNNKIQLLTGSVLFY